MSWYRTYRPQTVASLHSKPVREALETILRSGSFSHAYLLSGPRGTGKTSAARILAKILNCVDNASQIESQTTQSTPSKKTTTSARKNAALHEPCNHCASCLAITAGSSLSVLEMDAASHRGIDDIRELRDRVGLKPPDGSIAVIIIDEVHMLTTEAANALLKILEEPPRHVVFLLATTDPLRLPATILSRCTPITSVRATDEEIATALRAIATAERIEVEDSVIAAILRSADGSFRDGVKLFELIASGKKTVTLADVTAVVGIQNTRLAADLLQAIQKKDRTAVVSIFSKLNESGGDGILFQKEVFRLCHEKLVEYAQSEDRKFKAVLAILQAIAVPLEPLIAVPWMPFEIACIRACEVPEVPQSSTLEPISTAPLSPKPRQEPVQTPKETTSKETKKMQPKESPLPPVNLLSTDAKPPPTLEQITAQWSTILATTKARSAPIEGFLRRCRITLIDGALVEIEAAYSFHKEQLELERNSRIVEEVLSTLFSSPLRIRIVLASTATRFLTSPDNNISGAGIDEPLVHAAAEAFLSP